MRSPIAREGWPFVLGVPAVLALAAGGAYALRAPGVAFALGIVALAGCALMLFFFRDPERQIPEGPAIIVSGADGVVRAVEEMREDRYLHCDTVRVSVFLSLFNVHINRAPLGGRVMALEHVPGKFVWAYDNRASSVNQCNSIVIEGAGTRCLVRQIVGPVARRVVHWLKIGQQVGCGERIGLMKFGSRLDVYFPRDEVEIRVRAGDRLRGGETAIGIVKTGATR